MVHRACTSLLLAALSVGCDRGDGVPLEPPWPTASAASPPAGTPGEADRRIALEIRARLAAAQNLTTDRDAIAIAVAGGVVRLTGTADDPAQRRAVEVIARSVPGVAAVENQLELNPR